MNGRFVLASCREPMAPQPRHGQVAPLPGKPPEGKRLVEAMPRPRRFGLIRSSCHWYEPTIPHITNRPGCYAAYAWSSHEAKAAGEAPRLIYIGSANNIRARLKDHGIGNRRVRKLTAFGPLELIRVKVAEDDRPMQHLTREARLIRRLSPPMNRTTWRTRK